MLFADENIQLILDLAELHDPAIIIKNFIAGINAQTKTENFHISQNEPKKEMLIFPIETQRKKYGFLSAYDPALISPEDKTQLKKILGLLLILLSKSEYEINLNNEGEPKAKSSSEISPEITRDELNESRKAAINLVEDLNKEIKIRKEKESKLEASEASLKKAQNIGKIGSWKHDPIDNTTEWSDEMFSIFELEKQNGVPDWNEQVKSIHPDDWEVLSKNVNKAQSNKRPYKEQFRILKPDGTIKWAETTGEPVINSSGNFVNYSGTLQDITEQKLYEEQILESKEKYRFLLENLQESIWQIDENAVTVYTNEKLLELLGYTSEEMIGKPLFNFMDDEWKKKAETYFDDRKEGVKTTHEFCFEHKNGDQIYTLLSTAPLEINGEFKGALASIIDITDKKNTEKALQKSKTILEEAEMIANLGAWELDIEEKIFYFSDAWLSIHGVDESVLHIDQLLNVAHPDDLERISTEFEKAFKDNTPYEIEHRIINQKTKEVRNIKAHGKVISDKNGKPVKMFGTALDITELKKAAKALEESEKLLNEAQQIAKIGNWKYDIAADKTTWSDEMYKIFDLDPADSEPNWAEHSQKIHPDDWGHIDAAVKAASEESIPYKEEFRIVKSDGTVKWAESICEIEEDENGKPIVLRGTVQEITARKIAENQAKQKMKELQKLNSFMVDRETKMIELKSEINELLINSGKPEKYRIPQQ